MDSQTVTDKERFAIRLQAEDLVRRFDLGRLDFTETTAMLQALIEGCADGEVGVPQHNLAGQRRAQFETFWCETLGFDQVRVPFPTVGGDRISNRQFRSRARRNQRLYYRPPTSVVSNSEVKRVLAGGAMLCVADGTEYVWSDTSTGYWFWAEDSPVCPRVGMDPDDLELGVGQEAIGYEDYTIVNFFRLQVDEVSIDTATFTRISFPASGDGQDDDGDVAVKSLKLDLEPHSEMMGMRIVERFEP